MAYYDEPLVDPTADFETQQAVLEQQAARVKALRARADKGYTPDNQTTAGFTLSTGQHIPGQAIGGWGNIANAIAPLVAGYRADSQEKDLNTQQAALRQRMQADAINQISNVPQDTPYSATPTNAPSATNPGGNFVQADVTPAQTADRGKVLKSAMAMLSNPLIKATGTQFLADQLIKEPERVEARAERTQKAADTVAEARRKQQEDLNWRTWQQNQHNATLRAIAEGNQQVRSEATAARAADAGNWVPDTTIVGPNGEPMERHTKTGESRPRTLGEGVAPAIKPPNIKPLTDAQQKRQDLALESTNVFANAFHNYKPEYSGATARAKQAAGQYGLENEVTSYYAPIEKVIGLENKELSGASFTASEQERNNRYQPTAWKDGPTFLKMTGQRAIDSGNAHLRTTIINQNPGAYTDTDGSVVLPNGQRVTETKSRNITDGEIASKRLNLPPRYQDLDIAKVGNTPAARAARGGGQQPKGNLPPPPKAGDVVNGYRFKGGNPNTNSNWEPAS